MYAYAATLYPGGSQASLATVGFDWPEPDQVLDKIEEEIGELREAMAQGQHHRIEDELGDVMFAMVNLARHVNVKPELAVRSTNTKFERRFRYLETKAGEAGRELDQFDLDQQEAWWIEAKSLEASKP